jgi:hypothetical protein
MESALMTHEERLAQFRLNLDALCGRSVKTPRKLTGIEKHNLDPDPLDAIENEYQREFGS